MEETKEECNCNCEFFECGQRKLIRKQVLSTQSGILCGWVGDLCRGSACAYSACMKGRLRQDGSCGLFEKNVPKTIPFPSSVADRKGIDLDVSAIAKPKVLKKIKWYETE